jgi:transcription-repair coupling factor (superfamily II helicase)
MSVRGVRVGLGGAVEALVASERFERLLLARERPIVARAGGADAFLAAGVALALEAPVLLVAAGPHEASALAEACEAFLPGAVAAFPAWEALPYEGIGPSPDVAARRAEAIHRLSEAAGAFVVVAPAVAAMQGLIPTLGHVAPIRLAPGDEPAYDDLITALEGFGYRRTDVVEHRGEFAVRGAIVDVFPGGAVRPVRVEYAYDAIESVRSFTAATQLTVGPVEAASVPPVTELIAGDEVRERAAARARDHDGRIGDLLVRIGDGLHPEGMEAAAPFLFDRLPTLAELLPEGSWIVLADAERTIARAEHAAVDAAELARSIAWPGPPVVHALDDALAGRTRLHLTGFTTGIDLGITSWGSAQGNPPEMAARLRDLAERGTEVTVTGRGHGSLARVREVVGEAAGAVEAPLVEGFVFEPGGLAVATEEDVFGARRHTRTAPRFTARRADGAADELEVGDHAVHRIHGVGRFLGVVHRELAGAERDYLVLEYAAGDKLYVPSDAVGMVARYIGGDAPRVMRMGGSDWARATAKVKRAVRDMAGELVRLYTVRMSVPGRAFGPDTPWQAEMEDAFPHDETPDQLRVIDEVKADLAEPVPMDRLLCGDVGFGKTEVAVRAAFKAVMDGAQVAVLVPTTLLAEQHLLTFSERFAPYPVTVRMLSRFVSDEQQARTVRELAEGKVDVVIGTHRLLGRDVAFADLGLLVIDEEQRFGVSHKERLKAMRAQVDVLTMTATPIPRTLEMALTGIRQMSTIDTPPEDRQPVLTYVGSYEEDLALGAVRRELLREGQVFWVHNRVATIERQAAWLREQLPEARIVVAHGQMDEHELEQRMVAFWDREADVLVCTTIIESGLDVPNANTLIVDRADMLGLAQLYQLRGRVGRAAERAFAYLFFPAQREMTEEAHARLTTIARHQELGSGFKIAMRDLEIRGAGNLLGAEQSGHIAAVGFDAYARILSESVRELRGEVVEPDRELRIDLPVKAFVPPGWVAQESLRLELYRRIAMAPDHGVLGAIRAETIDRYGPLPDQVEVLFAIASLRLTAARLGVTEISTYRDEVRIRPLALPDALRLDLSERVPGAGWHDATSTLNLTPERIFGLDLVRWVEAHLRAALDEPAVPALDPELRAAAS